MEVMVKLAAVGVTAVVLSAVLKKNTPELALLLALAAGLWMLALTASGLGAVVELMNELAEQAGLSEVLLEPVVKTVALSILTRLTVEICRSAGEGGVAAFVETAGAVLALLAALPLTERTGRWYYLAALANYGAGNAVAAVDQIRAARKAEPTNADYRQAEAVIGARARAYQQESERRGFSAGCDPSTLCCCAVCGPTLCQPFLCCL